MGWRAIATVCSALLLGCGLSETLPPAPVQRTLLPSVSVEALRASLRQALAQARPPESLPAPLREELTRGHRWRRLQAAYGHGAQPPRWVDGRGVRKQAAALGQAVCELTAHGVDVADVPLLEELDAALAAVAAAPEGDARQARALSAELHATAALLALADAATQVPVDPRRIQWTLKREPLDPAALLQRAAADGPGDALAALVPAHDAYRRLERAHARYEAIVRQGGWPELPEGPALKEGSEDPRVPTLARVLSIQGDLRGEVPAATSFTPALAEAVSRFQRRHGLRETGEVDAQTAAALRVPAEDRLAQLRLNLLRWRWVPAELGARHVWVNVPAYELVLRDHGEDRLRSRVIVGRREWETPAFADHLEGILVNPPWHVTDRIAADELVPMLQEDPDKAARLGMTITDSEGVEVDPWTVDWSGVTEENLDYRFRQAPGDGNPLGVLKFELPNSYKIYLHDTASPRLFEEPHRALSHGCVRVEKAQELARLLAGDGEAGTQLEDALAGKATRRVKLPEEVPVYLTYFTAEADPDGTVRFHPDIYRFDRVMKRELMRHRPATARRGATEEATSACRQGSASAPWFPALTATSARHARPRPRG